jgi:hypothetical protein
VLHQKAAIGYPPELLVGWRGDGPDQQKHVGTDAFQLLWWREGDFSG